MLSNQVLLSLEDSESEYAERIEKDGIESLNCSDLANYKEILKQELKEIKKKILIRSIMTSCSIGFTYGNLALFGFNLAHLHYNYGSVAPVIVNMACAALGGGVAAFFKMAKDEYIQEQTELQYILQDVEEEEYIRFER